MKTNMKGSTATALKTLWDSTLPSKSQVPTPRVVPPLGADNPGIDDDLDARVDAACRRLSYLLKRVANSFVRRIPSHIELDDLIGAGSVGLVAAVRQHIDKPALDVKRLAERRIRGAILDYLRSIDHLTRRQRAAVTAVNKAKLRLAATNGTPGTAAEVAQLLGITEERALLIEGRLASVSVTSIDYRDQIPSHLPDPSETAMRDQTKVHVVAALAVLPHRLQTLLSLYYCESLTYKEIGQIMGISRSRICQLHTQAIDMLRQSMGNIAAA